MRLSHSIATAAFLSAAVLPGSASAVEKLDLTDSGSSLSEMEIARKVRLLNKDGTAVAVTGGTMSFCFNAQNTQVQIMAPFAFEVVIDRTKSKDPATAQKRIDTFGLHAQFASAGLQMLILNPFAIDDVRFGRAAAATFLQERLNLGAAQAHQMFATTSRATLLGAPVFAAGCDGEEATYKAAIEARDNALNRPQATVSSQHSALKP